MVAITLVLADGCDGSSDGDYGALDCGDVVEAHQYVGGCDDDSGGRGSYIKVGDDSSFGSGGTGGDNGVIDFDGIYY